MGIFFAFHFFTWIAAVQMTKVANAAICISLAPVFISIGAALFLKEKISKNIVFAMALGLLGVFVIGYDDFSFSHKYLLGDILAVISSLFFTAYFLIGKKIRDQEENLFIMILVYFFAAFLSFLLALVQGFSLFSLDLNTGLALLVLAILPTILGHASMIYVLRDLKASIVSTCLLSEPVLAGIGAYILFNEKVTQYTVIGYFLIMCALLSIVVNSRRSAKAKDIPLINKI